MSNKKRAIWKYPIEAVNQPFDIKMPQGAEIISTCFDMKTNRVCVWATVDPDETNLLPKTIILYSTGQKHEIPPDGYIEKFIGLASIQMHVKKSSLHIPDSNDNIQLVSEFYHVFEIIPPSAQKS